MKTPSEIGRVHGLIDGRIAHNKEAPASTAPNAYREEALEALHAAIRMGVIDVEDNKARDDYVEAYRAAMHEALSA